MQYASLISSESPAVTATARRPLLRTRLLGAGVALAAAAAERVQRRQRRRRRREPRACRAPARRRTTTARRLRRRTCSSSRSISGTTFRRTIAAARAIATTGGQAPMFARRDDINLAYTAANGVVTLMTPQDSTMVVKVGGGHNCWLASNAACGDILDHLDHELGRLDGFHGGSQDRARAARAARSGPEQELPGRPGRVVLDDGLPVARATLLRVPFVGLGAEATAVLRGRPAERLGRRRGRVRSRQVEDESRRPGDLALRRASARRVPQLLDAELRQRRERHADRDSAVQQRGAADGRRSQL